MKSFSTHNSFVETMKKKNCNFSIINIYHILIAQKQLFKEEMGLSEVMGLATRKCLKNNVQVEHLNKEIMIIDYQTLKSIQVKDDEYISFKNELKLVHS